jgi:methionine-R-sulfoxide reductase
MHNNILPTALMLLMFGFVSCQTTDQKQSNNQEKKSHNMDSVKKSDEEWKKQLTPDQYHVLREKGTESPGTGEYNKHFEKGFYTCAGCGTELFSNEQKFDSHCGWPSFDGELGGGDRIRKVKDLSFGMVRTEIVCAKCGGHLGHIFDDGPTQTGQRYCVNSLSLGFKPAAKDKEK